jgi:hypothetical protein
MVRPTYAPIALLLGGAFESLSPQFNFSNAHTTEPVGPATGLMSKTSGRTAVFKVFPGSMAGAVLCA